MRLSEAILLGSTIVEWKAGGAGRFGDGTGCALDMASLAVGAYDLKTKYQVLDANATPPCSCVGKLMGPLTTDYDKSTFTNVSWAIIHLFNYHVMTVKDWTLEQLVDWVRSVEPAEPPTTQSLPAVNLTQIIEEDIQSCPNSRR